MPYQPRLMTDQPEETAEDEARRAEYRERLREYLHDPDFRAIEGFPIGEDEDILALSDPPYYTACPNPFLPEILEQWQEERRQVRAELGLPDEGYYREPFAADVSEGKNGPIYYGHSYHTKVPHKAIMRYILHYTEPGDVVLDGFCGTGMTGVAAQLCGDREAVQALGYRALDDGAVLDEKGQIIAHLGARRAVLVDLCPAAAFIAYNYNTSVDVGVFEREAKRILREVEEECGWMYETWHPDCDNPNRVKGHIIYTIWSDVFVCPQCGGEIVFWEAAVDEEAGEVRGEFPCPRCGTRQVKRTLDRAWETVYDRALKRPVQRAKQVPVLINYSVNGRRYNKSPDASDSALIQRVSESDIPYWFPATPLPDGEKTRDPKNVGITHVHHFYTWRNLWIMAALLERCFRYDAHQVLFVLSAINLHVNKMRRYQPAKPGGTPNLPGTLYVGALPVELSPFDVFPRKRKDVAKALLALAGGVSSIETVSAGELRFLSATGVDYVFVDPPFGQNLQYSELNFLWEAWLKVLTNNQPEAVVNKVQKKNLPEYQILMEVCFREFCRVLKPGRWMTVEFHNSQNRVWRAIQEALQRASFVVADVRTFDKRQGTFNQVTASGAVKRDLIISAYKPNEGLEDRFRLEAGTQEGAWDFLQYHLGRLPVPSLQDGQLEMLAERQDYLLYDRMVAFHVQRGASVPLGAAEFYAGLRERFPERDGMFFLPDQAAEYDRRRLQAAEVVQLPLIVTDEKSAIQWLRLQLEQRPRTLGDLQPLFMREAQRAWEQNEQPVELRELLEDNFLPDDQDRWYVPDPNKAQDLERLRERSLLREFRQYAEGKGRLKVFRKEAVVTGFRRAWRDKDYATIIQVARRLPSRVLQEDPALLMYYDNAAGRVEG